MNSWKQLVIRIIVIIAFKINGKIDTVDRLLTINAYLQAIY